MEAVQDFPECDFCLEKQEEMADSQAVPAIALCPKCQRQILPQLKQPGWARLIGFQAVPTEPESEPVSPVAKAIRRNGRKYGKLAAKTDDLLCHFCAGGCSTPVRTASLMCGPCGEEKRSRFTTSKQHRTHYTGLKGAA